MKKIMILSVICMAVIMACHKKTVPVIQSRTEFPDPPKSNQPTLNENSAEYIAAGKKLYEGKCIRCHDLKNPKEYNAERWTAILRVMIPRARLDEVQAKEVTVYVMDNAKK